jgi:hypothetical protein
VADGFESAAEAKSAKGESKAVERGEGKKKRAFL